MYGDSYSVSICSCIATKDPEGETSRKFSPKIVMQGGSPN